MEYLKKRDLGEIKIKYLKKPKPDEVVVVTFDTTNKMNVEDAFNAYKNVASYFEDNDVIGLLDGISLEVLTIEQLQDFADDITRIIEKRRNNNGV